MAVTTLDAKTALVVIDLQHGIVARPTAHPAKEVAKGRAPRLTHSAATARPRCASTLPVCGARGTGSQRRRAPSRTGRSRPGAEPASGSRTVTKRTWGAFTNTGLERHSRQ